jgi:endonuclease/exonuclease/phosphatase (EEP) superfamily protein YafD
MAGLILRTTQGATGIAALAVALYFLATAILDYEGNFLVFIWHAFAPTTTIILGIVIALRTLIRRNKAQSHSRFGSVTLLLLFVAALAPIIREWRFLSTPPRPSFNLAEASFAVFDMNLLGHRDITPQVFPEIRRRNPDIVLLQEVTPEIADKLKAELSVMYPCQIADPRPGSYGMATLTRHPCEAIPFTSAENWVGRPQITKVSLPDNHTVLAVNIHGIHPHALIDVAGDEGFLGELANTVHAREAAITEVLHFLKQFRDAPSVMGGDLNSTMRNRVYALIRNAGYEDSWLTSHSFADIIFHGGTWPFAERGIPPLLAWLLRIDFVFYSKQLIPTRVELLPASLGSDHRGLFGEFAITQQGT